MEEEQLFDKHAFQISLFTTLDSECYYGVAVVPEFITLSVAKLLAQTVQSNLDEASIIYWCNADNSIGELIVTDQFKGEHDVSFLASAIARIASIASAAHETLQCYSIHFSTIQDLLGGNTQFVTHKPSNCIHASLQAHYKLAVQTCELLLQHSRMLQ